MTLRTKSKIRQWMVWLCAALVFLVAYIALSLVFNDAIGWNPFDYRCHRLMLPLVVLFIFVARVTRWDGVRRKVSGSTYPAPATACVIPDAVDVPKTKHEAPSTNHQTSDIRQAAPDTKHETPSTKHEAPSTIQSSGEELFEQARALPHHSIPDFGRDGKYLELLGKSAASGYAPALAKLGEYAMRRAAWVEAYYWMTMARRNGMHGLSPTLNEILQNWVMGGFSDEAGNVSELFSPTAGSISRALLHINAGCDAAKARKFLKIHHPNFLSDARLAKAWLMQRQDRKVSRK